MGLGLIRELHRDAGRFAYLSSAESPNDLYLVTGSDRWNGEEITVVWMEPVSPKARVPLPPGMRQLPGPGETVVSPALGRLLDGAPQLASRFPRSTILDWPGVSSGGEYLAFVRVDEGILTAQRDYRRIQNGEIVGEGPTKRVSGFGPRQGIESTVYARGADLPGFYIAAGLAAMLGVPAVLVLLVGLSCGSPVRAARFHLLRVLGAPTHSLRSLAAIESVALAAPGVVAVVALWAIISPHVTRLPLVGRPIAPGDLGWPFWTFPLMVAVGLLVTALLAMAEVTFRRPAASPRPTITRSRLRWWVSLPLGLSALAFTASAVVGGRADADLIMLGAFAAVLGVPLVVPALLRFGGSLLSGAGHVAPFLTGRLMSWSPEWMGKAFLGITAILVLTVGGLGYVAVAAYTEPAENPSPDPAVSAVAVQSLGPTDPAAKAALAAALPGTLIAAAQSNENADPGQPGPLSLGTTCPQLQARLPSLTCDPNAPQRLTDADARRLAPWLQIAAEGRVGSVTLVSPEALPPSDRLVVIGSDPVAVLDQKVRTASAQTLSVFLANSAASATVTASPLVDWIRGGLLAANIALGTACLFVLVDRLIDARRAHRHLLNLGVLPRRLSMIFASLFAIPYAISAAAGLGGGFLVCLVILNGTAVPWVGILAVVVGTFGAGILGAVANAALGTRAVLTDRD